MNLCIFSGRLTGDAKTSSSKNGKFYARYGLAIPVGWGENKRTVFVNCTQWNCEKLAPHLTKGTPVLVRGQYDEHEFEKDGEMKKYSEIIVAELEFQQGAPKQQQQQTQQGAPEPRDMPYEDNIPF